ncbi:hypothetical protein DRF65_12855 [Chryseobacterium pennae]|uniref:Uncharacterized protein n=1 Tax=Chryseobacterium pennae TaxID=2258962 RepID=A0A3D9C8T7_9FLAO|nr:hypothetical protein DRF65_12855 [Chryseobacterium pennae]
MEAGSFLSAKELLKSFLINGLFFPMILKISIEDTKFHSAGGVAKIQRIFDGVVGNIPQPTTFRSTPQ